MCRTLSPTGSFTTADQTGDLAIDRPRRRGSMSLMSCSNAHSGANQQCCLFMSSPLFFIPSVAKITEIISDRLILVY